MKDHSAFAEGGNHRGTCRVAAWCPRSLLGMSHLKACQEQGSPKMVTGQAGVWHQPKKCCGEEPIFKSSCLQGGKNPHFSFPSTISLTRVHSMFHLSSPLLRAIRRGSFFHLFPLSCSKASFPFPSTTQWLKWLKHLP